MCAWDGYEQIWDEEFTEEHRQVLEQLNVPVEEISDGFRCRFTGKTARGFQLMHVFLHEVGHHYDRMQTKRKICAPRGEGYAEGFANRVAEMIWPRFYREFEL